MKDQPFNCYMLPHTHIHKKKKKEQQFLKKSTCKRIRKTPMAWWGNGRFPKTKKKYRILTQGFNKQLSRELGSDETCWLPGG